MSGILLFKNNSRITRLMSRTKRSYHAAHLKARYLQDFPDAKDHQELLESKAFEKLPAGYFARLEEKGYGFGTLEDGVYSGMATAVMLKDLKGLPSQHRNGLEIIIIDGFNIFQSMENNARLDTVRRGVEHFAFLEADYGEKDTETFPVIANKQEYAQPLLLHQVIKRAHNAIFKKQLYKT